MVNSMNVEKEAHYKTYDIARTCHYRASHINPSLKIEGRRIFTRNEHVLMNSLYIGVRNEIDNIVDSTLCW